MIEMSLSDVVAATATQTPKVETPAASPATPETSGAIITEAQAHAHRPRSSAFLKPPVLGLAQKVGALGDTFPAGEFVFDKTATLGAGAKAGDGSLHMILLACKEHFVQHLPYGTEGVPESYATEDAVLAAGGVLRKEDDDTGTNWFRPAADLIVLVRAPENVGEDALPMFPFEVDGRNWGPALWYVRATAVVPLIGRGFGRAKMILGKTPWLGQWNVMSSKQSFKGNTYYTPSATFVNKIDPDSELGKLAAEKAAELAV